MPPSELWNVDGAGTIFSAIFTILCFGGGVDKEDDTVAGSKLIPLSERWKVLGANSFVSAIFTI